MIKFPDEKIKLPEYHHWFCEFCGAKFAGYEKKCPDCGKTVGVFIDEPQISPQQRVTKIYE